MQTPSSTSSSSSVIPVAGIVNAVVLLLCVGAIGLSNYAVDPYDLRGADGLHADKKHISYPRSYYHWALAEFKNRPASAVFFGDSRMNSFYSHNEARIEEAFGADCYNFSFGGATLYDCVSAFWYANDRADLKRVYLGLNFNFLNDAWPANRCQPAIDLIASPLKYYLNPFITTVTLEFLFRSFLSADTAEPGTAATFVDPSVFWEFQLAHTADQQYGKYVYPREGLAEIEKVARYCESRGIELTLIYFPTHVDLQNRVADYELTDAYRKSKREVSRMATFYDYDYVNEITSDSTNFSDPYHFAVDVGRRIFDEVVLQHPWMSKQ